MGYVELLAAIWMETLLCVRLASQVTLVLMQVVSYHSVGSHVVQVDLVLEEVQNWMVF